MLKTSICKYVVQYNNLQKKVIWNDDLKWCQERQFAKKQCLEQQQKCCPGKWPFYRNICQEDRCRICSVYCISMVKYWHAVWLNIALHFLFVGKFKKAGAIKGQVIMEQLFAASYRLLPAAAVQYRFIKNKYFQQISFSKI